MSDGSTTTLFLLRHGRTDWNRTGRWHGQADVPLDELGAQQARAFAQLAPGLRPDVIATSPLARARQTSAAVAEVLRVPVDVEPGLMEVDVGDWEGLVDAEVIRLDPNYGRAQGADRRFSARGETPNECATRMSRTLVDLAARHRGGRVLVVTHAYAIRAGVGALLGWNPAATDSLTGLFNCAYAELSLHPADRWELVAWNICHASVPRQREGEVVVVRSRNFRDVH